MPVWRDNRAEPSGSDHCLYLVLYGGSGADLHPDWCCEREAEWTESSPCAYEVSHKDGWGRVKFSGGNQNLFHVLDYLREHDILTGRVYTEQPTLNDVFLEMTGREMQD